ncbi:MAG: DUF4249 domain-containing protein, partial [Bacteroides sp.]|nr:DUF4249 domain-containing protein [Bacteroides sp.]
MKKSVQIMVVNLFLLAFFLGCISDYTVGTMDGLSDILVVEGFITETESTFKLSRSLNISDPYDGYPAETEVSMMYVECNDGSQSEPATYIGSGEYRIKTGNLDTGKQYRLYFRLNNGEEYASEFLTPLITPEIHSINYIKPAKGSPVQICVNTAEEKDQSRYFFWSYVEDWEVWAPLEADHGLNENDYIYKYEPHYNTYYCWGNNVSKSILLGSTMNLAENKLSNYPLLEISPYSDKFSVLYHIRINQNLIRKEAYDYFYNLLKNTDQNSGLFTSMPTEIKGNIRNLSQPEVPVIGYVEVSTTTLDTRFIDYSEGLYELSTSTNSLFRTCDEEYITGPPSGKRPDDVVVTGYIPYT